jgi:anti-sigma B factor antagonist
MTWIDANFVVVSPAGAANCVVKTDGEIDLASGLRFRQTLVDALREQPRTLSVDMADVSFIDSTGLSVLAAIWKAGEALDVEVVIQAPSAAVLRVLELTGLDRVLHIAAPEPGPTPLVT